MRIRLDEIVVAKDTEGHGLNPRGEHLDTTELQQSMSDPRVGQIEPIVVAHSLGDEYLLLSGHRRVVAARALGWKDIEAVVKELPDTAPNTLRAAMLAAHASEAHDPLRVAGAIRAMLLDGWDKLAVSRVMACQPQKIDILLALTDAPKSVQDQVAHGAMTLTAYGALYARPADVQEAVARRVQAKAPGGGKRGPGRPSGALTVAAVKREVREIAAERNPRLLDDEALVVKLNSAVETINEIVLQYAGGLPSNLAWRMGNQLAECERGIGKLLGYGARRIDVPKPSELRFENVPSPSAQMAEVAKAKLPSMFKAKSFSLKSCDDCGNDLPVNSRAAVCPACRTVRQQKAKKEYAERRKVSV